ncbi:hypothetical protein Hanom_Chr05g00416311 [Helianthus anomalus]
MVRRGCQVLTFDKKLPRLGSEPRNHGAPVCRFDHSQEATLALLVFLFGEIFTLEIVQEF